MFFWTELPFGLPFFRDKESLSSASELDELGSVSTEDLSEPDEGIRGGALISSALLIFFPEFVL